VELIGDGFNGVSFDDLTTAFTELDFNDWNIYELAKEYKATIVTDDSDFIVENYRIVTNNKDLLKLI
jgi:predicted nuclease of predicted toxin-antitoxin system